MNSSLKLILSSGHPGGWRVVKFLGFPAKTRFGALVQKFVTG
jgi:hypothetical protein